MLQCSSFVTHKRFETVVCIEERTKHTYICEVRRSNEPWEILFEKLMLADTQALVDFLCKLLGSHASCHANHPSHEPSYPLLNKHLPIFN